MCVIAIIEKDLPTLKTLKAMADANRDGIGLAYAKGGKAHFIKGIGVKELHAMLPRLPKPIVVHFRMATVGGKSKQLCHPFPIEPQVSLKLHGTAPSVFFHNGHISNWQEKLLPVLSARGMKIPLGDWSDSRGIALLVSLLGEGIIKMAGWSDRFAVLYGAGSVKTFGSWTTYEGVKVSNTNFTYCTKVGGVDFAGFDRGRHISTAYQEHMGRVAVAKLSNGSTLYKTADEPKRLGDVAEKLTGDLFGDMKEADFDALDAMDDHYALAGYAAQAKIHGASGIDDPPDEGGND